MIQACRTVTQPTAYAAHQVTLYGAQRMVAAHGPRNSAYSYTSRNARASVPRGDSPTGKVNKYIRLEGRGFEIGFCDFATLRAILESPVDAQQQKGTLQQRRHEGDRTDYRRTSRLRRCRNHDFTAQAADPPLQGFKSYAVRTVISGWYFRQVPDGQKHGR